MLGANREGLYLAPYFLFRLGSPPLFIPWHEVRPGERRRRFMLGEQRTLLLGREEGIPFELELTLAEKLLACASDERLNAR